jgi:hypothetical protein
MANKRFTELVNASNMQDILKQHAIWLIYSLEDPPEHYKSNRGKYWINILTDKWWVSDSHDDFTWHTQANDYKQWTTEAHNQLREALRLVKEIAGYE